MGKERGIGEYRRDGFDRQLFLAGRKPVKGGQHKSGNLPVTKRHLHTGTGRERLQPSMWLRVSQGGGQWSINGNFIEIIHWPDNGHKIYFNCSLQTLSRYSRKGLPRLLWRRAKSTMALR